MIETYFSPSIDVLTRHCQACLNLTSRDATSKSQTPSDLLAEVISPVHDPVIITPSSSIKSELMRAFTQADKVTAGIEWQTRAGILKDCGHLERRHRRKVKRIAFFRACDMDDPKGVDRTTPDSTIRRMVITESLCN